MRTVTYLFWRSLVLLVIDSVDIASAAVEQRLLALSDSKWPMTSGRFFDNRVRDWSSSTSFDSISICVVVCASSFTLDISVLMSSIWVTHCGMTDAASS